MTPVRRAAAFVGVPYVLHGQTPTPGWDCLGLVRYLRGELFGLETPPWSSDYGMGEALGAPRADDLIRAHLGAWQEVEVRPGAVLLFRRFGRAGHVGLALGEGQFIHAEQGSATALLPLAGRWEARILGAYDQHRSLPRAQAVQPPG